MKKVKGLENDVLYAGHEKPVEQCLDEKWFLWFRDDEDLKRKLQEGRQMWGEGWTAYKAFQEVMEYVVEMLTEDVSGMVQMAIDYTDWMHLTKRLMDNFGLQVVNQEVLDSA